MTVPVLEKLTKKEIQELINACVNFDAGNILGPDFKSEEVVSYGIPEMNLFWKTKDEFGKYIEPVTRTGSIAEANKALEKRLPDAPAGPSQTVPTEAERKSQEVERVSREAQEKETAENAEKNVRLAKETQERLAKEALQKEIAAQEKAVEETTQFVSEEQPVTVPVQPILYEQETPTQKPEQKEAAKKPINPTKEFIENAIKRQRTFYAEEIQKTKEVEAVLNNQKIYYKIEKPLITETQEITNLKKQVEADPKRFIGEAANQYKNNPNLKNLSPNEIKIATEQAAITTFETLNDNSPTVQVAIINSVIADPKILHKIAPDVKTQTQFKNVVQQFIEQKATQFEFVQKFINTSKIDGITNPENIVVEISETPQEGFKEFDLNRQIVSPHIENLNQQSLLLDNFKGFGEREIRSQILSGAGNRLESYIATLPTNSLLAKTYNSEIVQLGLSSLGIVEVVPWVAVEGSLFGQIVVGSGFGPVAGFIQAKTGIDLGIKKVAVEIGKKTVEKVSGQAAGQAAAKVATGILPKVFAALGAAASWVTAGLSLVVGWILGKIVEKINWKKVKEWGAAIFGGLAGLIALPFVGLGAAIGIGLGTTGISMALGGGLGGLTLGGIGSGVVGFFGAIGGAFIGAVATPILITLLAFPVVVALILFIINSGAYIVPPSSSTSALSSENAYIGVEKTATPTGPFQNSDLPKTITYNITVTAKRGVLTNITITDDCGVISKTGSAGCPAAVIPTAPDSISPSAPYSFSYTTPYSSSKYFDSVITNTITIAATTDSSQQSASGSTAIIIGSPPTACFTFDDSWKSWPNWQTMENQVTAAIGELSQATVYMSTLCGAWGTIPLSYSGEPEPYAGFFTGSGIHFYQFALSYGIHGTLYTLTHESGHAYAARVQGAYGLYLIQPGIPWEKICTYLPSYHPPSEDYAEMIGLYVSKTPNVDTGCMSNFKTQYANYWQFAHDHIFFQNLGW